MGLPGSGKTTLARALVEKLQAEWFNADEVRSIYNDWDFSKEGRIRQAKRLRFLADNKTHKYVVVDFIAALKEQRKIFNADFTIWLDTIQESRFNDTNKAFEPPLSEYNLRLVSHNSYNINDVVQLITDCI